jgi:hypothetical protein
LNCVSDCPKSSLSTNIFGYQVNKKLFGLVAVLSFFIPLIVILMTPIWQTKAPSNIVTTDWKIDVANIRSSNSLVAVVKESGVPLEVFVRELNLPSDIDASLLLKEIRIKYNLKNKESVVLEIQNFSDIISAEMSVR